MAVVARPEARAEHALLLSDPEPRRLFAELAIYGLPESYLTDYVPRLHAVTKADVRKLAGKVLKLDKMTVVVVGDRKANEASLAGIAPVELRDLEGAPLGAPAKGEGTPPSGDKE